MSTHLSVRRTALASTLLCGGFAFGLPAQAADVTQQRLENADGANHPLGAARRTLEQQSEWYGDEHSDEERNGDEEDVSSRQRQ